MQKGDDTLLGGGETLDDVRRGEGRGIDGGFEDGKRCDSSERGQRGQRVMEIGNDEERGRR